MSGKASFLAKECGKFIKFYLLKNCGILKVINILNFLFFYPQKCTFFM